MAFLLTGILWFLVAIIILRFDYTSVSAISILFGVVAIFAGVDEFLLLAASGGWWKVLHGLLGVLFIGVGIVAFIHPGDTFAALAAVMSFFLLQRLLRHRGLHRDEGRDPRVVGPAHRGIVRS